MAGVAGRSGRRAETPFRDALRLALGRLEKDEGRSLAALATKLITKASEGDMAAIKEIADRLDGKPTQPLEGGDTPLQMKIIAVWGGAQKDGNDAGGGAAD